MKAVFVLVTQDAYYVRMFGLAVASLIKFNPSFVVTVICDKETEAFIQVCPGDLPKIDEIISVEMCEHGILTRSRLLKCRARSIVHGDFLFIDCDVIVRGSLAALFSVKHDFAAVRNLNSKRPSVDRMQDGEYLVRGFSIPRSVSLNSGVMFWRDTPPARELAKRWERLWRAGVESSGGRYNDQQALNVALEESGINHEILEDRYNAQIWWSMNLAPEAVVWHFIMHNSDSWIPTYWHQELASTSTLSKCPEWVSYDHPFIANGFFDKIVINSLVSGRQDGDVKDPRRIWLKTRNVRSALNCIKKLLSHTLWSRCGRLSESAV